ncbi:MAG: hypothetical protein ACI915_003478 [Gammaproteobacteria bacterium]|jgi:hypothetical protein
MVGIFFLRPGCKQLPHPATIAGQSDLGRSDRLPAFRYPVNAQLGSRKEKKVTERLKINWLAIRTLSVVDWTRFTPVIGAKR